MTCAEGHIKYICRFRAIDMMKAIDMMTLKIKMKVLHIGEIMY